MFDFYYNHRYSWVILKSEVTDENVEQRKERSSTFVHRNRTQESVICSGPAILNKESAKITLTTLEISMLNQDVL